ncbi:MAG TPA: MFS transporter [Anaerolineales bacterium]|nr:MFS transporter [Anaerolineales bacterium]
MSNISLPPYVSKRLGVFLVAMALAETARTMTAIQIPVYLRSLGADVGQIGLFFTLSGVLVLAMGLMGGWLSDALGRLRALALGSAAGVFSYAAFALVRTWWLALIGAGFLAVSVALTWPSYKAYVADFSSEKYRGRVFGLSESAVNMAWIFGAPVGGFLAQQLGFRFMFVGAAMLFALAADVFLVLDHLSRRSAASTARPAPTLASMRTSLVKMAALVFSGGLVTWLLITDGVRDVAFRLSFDLMPVYLTDVGGLTSQQIGLLDGLFGIVLVAFGFPAGWFADKTSDRVGLISGLIMVLSSRLTFAFASGFWGFTLSWSMLAIGVALMDPPIQSLISKGVPQSLRGISYALVTTSIGIVSLPSPWIGGQLWNMFGPQAPFLFTVALGSLAIIPAWFKLVVPKGVADEVDTELDAAPAD